MRTDSLADGTAPRRCTKAVRTKARFELIDDRNNERAGWSRLDSLPGADVSAMRR